MSKIKYLLLSMLAASGIAAWIFLMALTKALWDIYWFFHA